MNESSPTKGELSLWELLALTRQVMFKVRTKEVGVHGISATKGYILSAIDDLRGQATPSTIAQWHFREQHTISEVLTRMEKEGLVRKRRDLKKKSMVRIELTEKGRDLEHKSDKRYSVHRIMSSLNNEQRQQLKHCLQILLDSSLKELGVSHFFTHYNNGKSFPNEIMDGSSHI